MGVRFGAFYIYVPALLKPASRTLCTQLWALLHADAEKQAIAERLLHFASSGRTSFAVEPPASGEVYRVAGFRLCGDRAVRVDIVERLTDLIRAALPRPTPLGSARADGGRRRGVRRHQSDDVFDRLFGRAFRLDSALSRFRQPQGEEVGISRRGAPSRRRGGELSPQSRPRRKASQADSPRRRATRRRRRSPSRARLRLPPRAANRRRAESQATSAESRRRPVESRRRRARAPARRGRDERGPEAASRAPMRKSPTKTN